MAPQEFAFEPCEHEDLEVCLRWLVQVLDLRDWHISLSTGTDRPRDFDTTDGGPEPSGLSSISTERLRAALWVPIGRLSVLDDNPYEVLCHEVLHVHLCSCGLPADGPSERATRTLSPQLYKLYCFGVGDTPAKERVE